MLKSIHLLDWSHLRDRDVGLSHPTSTAPTDARKKKVVNDAVAYLRGLAQMHGRLDGLMLLVEPLD